MADLTPLNFNPANIEDMGDGFKVFPPGIYTVIIVESDVTDTKAAGGKILILKDQIVDGPFAGEVLIDRLNIVNKSEVAQKIGNSQLKNICDAVGFVGLLPNSEKLHGIPFSVKVAVEPFTNREGKVLQSNKIDKRMPKQASRIGEMPAAPLLAPPSTAQGSTTAKPWG